MSNKINQAIIDATLLMRQQHSGVLSTISVSVEGYPFGSITPFILTGTGDILIYASDIAQHTRNIKSNPKVSLFVHDPDDSDSQANARVTVLGEAFAADVEEENIQRYFRLFPQAKGYAKTHDFRFYLIKTVRVRFIGGFGEIYWLPEEQWRSTFVDIKKSESGAIQHMHEDHADALKVIVEYATNSKLSETPQLLSIVHDGMHFKTGEETIFVPFLEAIKAPEEMRSAVVQITQHAREA